MGPFAERLRKMLSTAQSRNALFFAFEGAAFSFFNSLVNNNNNLYITRLGATDLQLSLNTMLPQLVGMLVLLPGGLISDRLTNKRRMVMGMLATAAVIFFLIGFVPAMGSDRLIYALFLYAVSAIPMTLYNASWQAFFSDVIPPELRNSTLSVRTRITFVIAIAVPLVTGMLLSSVSEIDAKLRFHQVFLFCGVGMLLIQLLSLSRISGDNVDKKPALTVSELVSALKGLAKNRQFIFFSVITIFFYISWHIDWTLHFIGQVRYLGFNESWLSYVSVGVALMQFATIGIWSRVNEKKGARFGIIFAPVSLAFSPLSFFVATSLPIEIGRIAFVVMCILSNFGFATFQLNTVQCLLQVVDKNYKTLSISIYTVFVTLSNALMPTAGVQLYTTLGGDLTAFLNTFLIVIALRVIAVILFIIRYKLTKHLPK